MKRANKKSTMKTSLPKKIIQKIPMVFATVAILYVALLLKDIEVPTILPVEDILVEGELKFLDKKEIMGAVTDNITGGYFSVDLNHVREVLLQKPWVKDVSLRRKWPASVSVYVEEHKPMAFWNSDAYISESGDVFKPVTINKQLNLPQLNGPETQHDNVLKFMNVLYKQMALLDYEVKRLALDDRRAWQVVIEKQVSENGVTDDAIGNDETITESIDVRLGRFDTEKRLQRFIRVLPALTTEITMTDNKIEVIDMRYPNGFAVKMAEQVAGPDKSVANDLIFLNITHKNTQSFVYAHRYATVSMSGA